MFDLDIGKMVLVAVVALVVVGPKELPVVLRAVGQAAGRLRSLQFSVRKAFADIVADADCGDVGRHLASVEQDLRRSLATNPATAMRGTLPVVAGAGGVARASRLEVPQYASPEMQAYLSPEPPSPSQPTDGYAEGRSV